MSYQSTIFPALNRYAERVALEAEGRTLSYQELSHAVDTVCETLSGVHMAALMMANSPAWVILDLACVKAGVPLLPLPEFFSEQQIQHALADAGVDTIFTDQPERFMGRAEWMVVAGQPCYRIHLNAKQTKLPSGTAKITYTSGTTNTPKGVCLRQEAMETVASSLLKLLPHEALKRHICLLPLGVLLENVAGIYTALLAGATICLPPVKHEPAALYAAIMEYRATSCILVPELLRMLLAVNKPLPTMRYAAVGGARVAPDLLRMAQAKGIPVYEGYGLSELSSVVAVNTPETNRVGTVGKPLPHIQLKISKQGEVMIRNPLFSGYLGSKRKMVEWYPTGDVGRMDEDGFLIIEGRKKNIYITSFGRNISPEWVESLLTSHPAIAQAVVYGEAKPYSVAVIVAREPECVAEAIEQLNAVLPDYAKVGKHLLAHGAFTIANHQLTGTGRPRRQEIYKQYEQVIEACYAKEATL